MYQQQQQQWQMDDHSLTHPVISSSSCDFDLQSWPRY